MMLKIVVLLVISPVFVLGESQINACPDGDRTCQVANSGVGDDKVSLLAVQSKLHKASAKADNTDEENENRVDCTTWALSNSCEAQGDAIVNAGGQGRTGFCNPYWKWSAKAKYGLTPGEAVKCRNTGGAKTGCRAQSVTGNKQKCRPAVLGQIVQTATQLCQRQIAAEANWQQQVPLSSAMERFLGNEGLCAAAEGTADCAGDLGVPKDMNHQYVTHFHTLEAAKQAGQTPQHIEQTYPDMFGPEDANMPLPQVQAQLGRVQGIDDVIQFVEGLPATDAAQFKALRGIIAGACGYAGPPEA